MFVEFSFKNLKFMIGNVIKINILVMAFLIFLIITNNTSIWLICENINY